MKKVFQIALAASVVVGAISCGQQEDKTVETETTVEVVTEVVSEREAKEKALGNAEKVQVNEAMKEYPKNCQKLVNKYIENQETDYLALADNLGGQNKKLIGACTMKGESHDALHKWLEPNIELVSKLGLAQTQIEANQIVKELQASYVEYNNSFE